MPFNIEVLNKDISSPIFLLNLSAFRRARSKIIFVFSVLVIEVGLKQETYLAANELVCH